MATKEKRPCRICGRAETANRQLCGKHYKESLQRNKTLHPSTAEWVKSKLADFDLKELGGEDSLLSTEITKDNAEEMKLVMQAIKEQELAKAKKTQNLRESGEVVNKSEANKATIQIVRGIIEVIENSLDALPAQLENKSAGQVKKILVKKFADAFKTCKEDLDELS